MQLPGGHKYGVVAFQPFPLADDLPPELELGPGMWALRNLPFGLPDHWRDWIGTLQADHLEECTLFLVASGPSGQPHVLDHENTEYLRRAQRLYWSLIFTDHIRCSSEPMTLTGANRDDEIDIRSLGRLRPPIHIVGTPLVAVDRSRLERSLALHTALADLFGTEGYGRVRRAVHTFYKSVMERDYREKLHQYLRVVEGFVNPAAGQTLQHLRSRTETFLGPRHHALVGQWFNARSAFEHLNDVDQAYDGPIRERRLTLVQNAAELEALARYCLTRFMESRGLWDWFQNDDSIENFWALPAPAREALWGETLDIDEIRTAFEPAYIDDEDLGLEG